MMYAFLTSSREQPCECEFCEAPEGLYMKISLSDSTAEALGKPPWHGGIPPYEWVTEQIALALGYVCGDGELPIAEYYGFFSMTTFEHDCRYLYVPVRKA